ncbi:MAG: type II toxin-antitoxin system RelE/ParE family toxin [Rhodanobacter sp.]
MSRVASFNRLAEVELREAILYYESEAPGLGRRFLSTVESALAEILDHPLTGAPLRGDVRRKQLGRFPYQLLYRLDDEEIRILAVMHKRRRPLYWAERG